MSIPKKVIKTARIKTSLKSFIKSGSLLFNWKVVLCFLNKDGNEVSTEPYVKSVHMIIHDDFKKPHR
ncbi:hypothetical protein HK099_001048, partial [Clydaea vesicula]